MHLPILPALLTLSTLTLAIPTDAVSALDKRTYCPTPSSAAPWQIYLFSMFTADPCCAGLGSTLSFNFTDPGFAAGANAGLSTACSWFGPAATQPDAATFYGCDECSVQWRFDGVSLFIEQEVDCGGTTKTAKGEGALDLTLYVVDGGTMIRDIDEVTDVGIGSVG